MLKTVTHVESHVKTSRCVENVYVRHVENHIENRVEVQKKTPSHFTARVEIERQISFFSFGFARVTEVRQIYFPEIFTEIGWMLENVNFSIAPNNNFNVRNF